MPSPFPGMDPYLEDPAFWRDFHGEFIYACRHFLLETLPPHYDAAVEEHLRLIEALPGGEIAGISRSVVPDVSSTQHGFGRPRTAQDDRSTATIEPISIKVSEVLEERDRWIEITHRPDGALVTAIEVLSPTNKTGDGFGEYRAKRQALLRQRANLVELDLLLAGRRVEAASRLPAGDFFALVSKTDRPNERLVYAWPLRHALPVVKVPLRPPDADLPLNVGAAFSLAYDRGRYARRLRYAEPAHAPLPDADRVWAEQLARTVR